MNFYFWAIVTKLGKLRVFVPCPNRPIGAKKAKLTLTDELLGLSVEHQVDSGERSISQQGRCHTAIQPYNGRDDQPSMKMIQRNPSPSIYC